MVSHEDLHWSLDHIQYLMELTVPRHGRGTAIACDYATKILAMMKAGSLKKPTSFYSAITPLMDLTVDRRRLSS